MLPEKLSLKAARHARRHSHPSDKVINITEAFIEPSEIKALWQVLVFVDDRNRATKIQEHKPIGEPGMPDMFASNAGHNGKRAKGR
jgi:aspartate 1-decarboxylase